MASAALRQKAGGNAAVCPVEMGKPARRHAKQSRGLVPKPDLARTRGLAAVSWYQTVHALFVAKPNLGGLCVRSSGAGLFESHVSAAAISRSSQRAMCQHQRSSRPSECSQSNPEEVPQAAESCRVALMTRKISQATASVLCAAAMLLGRPQIAYAGPSIAYAAEGGAFVRPERNGPIIDGASIIPDGREGELARGLTDFADKTGWKIRLITRNGPGTFPSGDEVRSVWNLDAKTIVVIDDVSSPNVLNFNTGDGVRGKLPRQFFTELQSRFGNQFYIAEEGNAKALMETVGALKECLGRDNGCRFVPGLVDDLYFLTLACSVAAGAVFGFSARVPLSGRVNNQLTWILTFAPLWAFLLVSFGILPVTSRTAELEPLLKNGAGFLAAAMAVYLTPILGTPELPFSGTAPKADADDDER